MFKRLIPFVYCLSLLLAAGLTTAPAQAQNSTGITLGTTDFGGKSRTDSGWSRADPGSRSWSRQAPADRTWSRDRSQTIEGGKHHHSEQKPHLGQYRDGHHHFKKHDRRYSNPKGIRGHRSYGYTDPYQRRHSDRHHRPGSAFYYRQGHGVNIYYAPDSYRDDSYERSTVINGGFRQTEPAYRPEPDTSTSIDPWDALADYQIHTARYAFEAQTQRQPHVSLPRVGLALSTALAGDLNAGAFAMEDALLSDTSDLRYFEASESVQLVVEELLLSYQGDPLMTATLHYLSGHYRDAQRAVEVAANYCQQCSAVNSLSKLIAEAL